MKTEYQDQYWATLPEEELLDALNSKIEGYYEFIQESGLHELWRRAFIAYYGGDLNKLESIFESQSLGKGGKAGQITKVKINNYRNLVKHSVNLAMANKTSLNCVASNTDSTSLAQASLGNSLLEYYLKVKKVGFSIRKAVEFSCLAGEGWIHLPWLPKSGEVYDVGDDGKPRYEGDLDSTYHGPYDVIRDVSSRKPDGDWRILREWRSKWDLIAEHPEFKDELLDESPFDYEENESFRFEITKGVSEKLDSDLIPVYTLYHGRTPAVRDGKLVKFTRSVVLYNDATPYESTPLLSVMPDTLHESCFGYSSFNDLLGLQQATDNLASSLLSNNLTFGNQFIWKRKGDNFSVKNIEGGLKLLESEEMPQGINLTASSPETFKLLEMLQASQETLSGISSTVRGSPQANLKSGAALALVVAQSIQFGSDLEESANTLLSDVGSTIVEHLKAFAKTPRMALITGEANRPFMKEFSKKDVSEIKRVTVEQTNALAKTISGRLEIAQQVMQMPPELARQYMAILNTGQLPPELNTPSTQMSIKAENEALRNGRSVRAIITENHSEHVKAHMRVVDNPEAKEDQKLVKSVLAHVQEHLNLWRKMSPDLLIVTGQQPSPMGMGPGLAKPQEPAKPQAPQAGAQGPSPQMAIPAAVQGPEGPKMPNMPNLPGEADPVSQGAYEKLTNNI